MKNTASKMTAILAALYVFFALGGVSAYVGVFAYLPEYADITLVQFSLAPSIQSITVAFLSFFGAAALIKKWGPRACMLMGSVLIIAHALLIGLFPGVAALYVGFALGGVVSSLSGVACLSELMVRWYAEKSTPYISLIVGCMFVGQGVIQGMAPAIMDAFGMRAVFLGEILICGVASLICALLVRGDPGDAAPSAPGGAEAGAVTAPAAKRRGSVLKNPAVWCMCIATLGIPLSMSPVLLYATDYFPSMGKISISAAGTMVGVMGIASGAYNMFLGGRLVEKIGPKAYAVWVMACMALTSVLAYLYALIPQIWVLVLIVACYAVGCTSSQLGTILAPALFGSEASTDVTAKVLSFMFIGNIIGSPMIATIVTDFGYPAVWLMAVCASALVIVIYLLTFALNSNWSARENVNL